MSSSDMAPTPDMIEAAARWAALLDAGDLDPAEQKACRDWCAEHPLHRRTLERMRAFDARVAKAENFEREALRSIVDRRRRRRPGVALLGLVLSIGIGWSAMRADSLRDLFPDYRTGPGEIRSVALGDGSEIVIDTDGAVRVDIGEDLRRVRLIRGQLLASVAKDKHRPFVVRTPDGTAMALGTRFVVRREPGYTVVTVVESRVKLCPGDAPEERACRVLTAGERARIRPTGIEMEARVDPSSAALWSSGWLEADDQDVTAVLTELARYSAKPLRFDAGALRGIRVTGSYPLRDMDRSIEGVARTAGLTVRRDAEGAIIFSRRP
ncbi:FecR family protein [Rhizorhabdus phycosphaerae]|uniref:FecR family protein n=1 Tax=Rhizorhabdus phycosphaerae TaxID=2711156 RepID=UPI0013EC30BA|nr:FecR domain-containing protein [Rhizorhabdus phycosphaerae]